MKTFPDLTAESFTDHLDGDFFHIRVEKEFDNVGVIFGFGSDSNEDMALQKAVSEVFERFVFKSTAGFGESSNGYACHTDFELASRKAIFEILERDSVMTGWLKRRPPYWLSADELNSINGDSIFKKIKLFKDNGFDLKLGLNSITNGVFTSVSALTSADIGFVFTSCTSDSLIESISGNISDQRRACSLIVERRRKSKQIYREVSAEEISKPQDHLEYYLNPKTRDSILWFLNGSQDIPEYKIEEIKVNEIPISAITPWKLTVARAETKCSQPFFTGLVAADKVNLIRLEATSVKELNLELHPLA